MQKIEQYLIYECIEALKDVNEGMRKTTVKNLVKKARSGKEDSLFLDVLPENILRGKLIDDYDEHLVLISEERGKFNFEEISEAEVVVFSDPTDRTKFLKDFLNLEFVNKRGSGNPLFGELLDSEETIGQWESFTNTPARLSGACCSITLVKGGQICFSMVLNYITQELVLACEDFIGYSFIKRVKIKYGCLDFSHWSRIKFPAPKNKTSYVTFLGKEHYQEYYEENLKKSGILDDSDALLEQEPGGPARILYLSNVGGNPAGFILSNGEKIGEWIHWLSFCKYSHNLAAYSVYPGTFFARDDVLMAPSAMYSILELRNKNLFINYGKLKFSDNPSRYREMILVCHKNNKLIQARVEAQRSRRLF